MVTDDAMARWHSVEEGRAILAKALVYAYRDALREGVEPWASTLFRGCLRELDALYPRAPFDPEPER